mmetsp:Transcript_11957/g.35803  ORF Transcript_11957/g.35803 Transcript_11957/m.35803 type:complete len:241 (-) Transcript_11957:4266-4988(-)
MMEARRAVARKGRRPKSGGRSDGERCLSWRRMTTTFWRRTRSRASGDPRSRSASASARWAMTGRTRRPVLRVAPPPSRYRSSWDSTRRMKDWRISSRMTCRRPLHVRRSLLTMRRRMRTMSSGTSLWTTSRGPTGRRCSSAAASVAPGCPPACPAPHCGRRKRSSVTWRVCWRRTSSGGAFPGLAALPGTAATTTTRMTTGWMRRPSAVTWRLWRRTRTHARLRWRRVLRSVPEPRWSRH